MARKCVAALLLLATTRLCSAGDFLSVAAVDMSLEEELGERRYNEEHLQEFVRALAPSFAALPKDEAGRLQHQTARYILHRFFVQQRGWYVKGLEPNGDTFHKNVSPEALKDWVPSYLLSTLEKRLQHKGLDLSDLAVLAAAIDDLAVEEARNLVDGIFGELRKNNQPDTLDQQLLPDAVLSYVASFLSNSFWDAETSVRSTKRFVREYHGWNRTRDWYQAIEQANTVAAEGALAPAALGKQIAVSIGAKYGTVNDQQCSELKGALLGMWAKGNATGRIRLVDFYRMGLDTQWDLVEKKEYLQALGAIDDSNASSPLVIIPNYLTSRPNCLEATNLYAVCCRNECEDILGRLETVIGAPEAEPERIMKLVSVILSDTVREPRDSRELESLGVRLHDIARDHGGKVKLHGRLFAQWMHHAYPSECPYPHEAGTADPASPDQWIGADVEFSEEERKQMVEESCSPEQAAAEWVGDLPWSHEEELLHDGAAPEHIVRQGESVGWPRKLLMLFALLAACVCTVAALKTQPNVVHKFVAAVQKISRKQVLLAALLLVCVALNIVNCTLFLVMLCVGLLLPRLLSMGTQQQKKRVEKCVV